MAEIRVRKIERWVVGWFRSQAKRHGRSLESELRRTLTETAIQRKRDIVADLRNDLNQLEGQYGVFSDSARFIREDRDARG